MNTIEWSVKAVRQLLKIDKKQQIIIKDAVGNLVSMPDINNVKSLTNYKYRYRLRVNDYRVFFDFDGVVKIVYIQEVKKRDDRTY